MLCNVTAACDMLLLVCVPCMSANLSLTMQISAKICQLLSGLTEKAVHRIKQDALRAINIAWGLLMDSPPKIVCTPQESLIVPHYTEIQPGKKYAHKGTLIYFRPLLLTAVGGSCLIRAKVANVPRTVSQRTQLLLPYASLQVRISACSYSIVHHVLILI